MAERHWNNSRLMQQAPERISGSREMMPNLFRAQTRIDTDEQNSRPSGQDITQWHRRNCTGKDSVREALPNSSPFPAQSLWAKRFDMGEDTGGGADFFALFFLPPSRLRKTGVRRLRLRRVWISKPER